MSIELIYDEFLYHQHHALSSTQARQILESPARYKWALTQPARTSDAFDIGHAVHAKVLGVGMATTVLDFDNYLTKAAKEARDQARADGTTPLLRKDALQVDAMSEAVLAHPEARRLFEQPGNPEASVFATCDETAIEMRARFDYLPGLDTADPIAVDLKTTGTKATAREFGKSISTYGYHIQSGHYLDALRLETARDDIGFRFVVVEKAAPHFVAVHQLDDLYSHIGIDSARDARRTLRECLDTDTWPTRLEDIQYIDAPNWLIEDVEVSI
ncbi:PD-(D/E)XK nuclease-like domain-containing protein [Agrococcus sp. DT81.2]|uniref:PD-(D/E)XK nuclease-like domain-containing protein n=1 Tax=Agrococcus sp. DT81.2 TaxID=3393414 RepID=UPI003CE4BC3D